MEQQGTDPAAEVKRLQRCMNNLVSVLALPAVWSDSELSRILDTFLDALLAMLDLDFLYARVRFDSHEAPAEALRTAQLYELALSRDEIRHALNRWSGEAPQQWAEQTFGHLVEREASVFPIRMGIEGELGLIVAGSKRHDFPEQTESLVLGVAANQLAIGLQQALRLSEQKRVASELDRRVAERTLELAEANKELELQVGLLQHLPVSAWTLKPDGTPDFVNQVWLEYSGQTLDFVRSHPEAWMSAVHPDDREIASKAFWRGIRSGQGFAMEVRSLRAQDGTYRWHLIQSVVLHDAEGQVLRFVGTTTDIDDQKRAEEALKGREHDLRLIIDTIPALVWCMLPDGTNEFISKGWHEFTGVSPEASHGWGWQESFHPDDLPSLMKKWGEVLASGEPGAHEARLRRRDGIYRWFLIRAEPFRDESGSIVRWYGTSTDIHNRKLAEEALQENERKLVSIINTIPTTAWSTRPDGHCEFLNQKWLDYAGMTAEQAQGWGWAAVIHPDDAQQLTEYWQSCLASGTPVDTEARMRRFDGTYRWFLFRANPLRDASGNIVKWYGTNIDIDDRKRAEDQVRRSEAYLEEAQHLARIGSFSWQVDANKIVGSEQLYRIYDFEPGSPLTFSSIKSRVHPDDLAGMNDVLERASLDAGDFEYEYRLCMRDGSTRYLHSMAHAIRDTEGKLEYIGAVQDVTQRHLAEEALTQARTELAHAARITSLGMLTASIAHEVNQPLSGIVTNTGTCLRMLNADPPNLDGARETAKRAMRDGNRASEVVSRLRSLYSKKEPSLEPMDLNEAAREVIALLLSELQRNGVILQCEYADHLPSIQGDRIQLQQVILNLVRNASDSMRHIEDRPRRLLIRTGVAGGDVCVTIQDSGIGFDPASAEQLFESFYTTKQDGMGIGLSISRSIVEGHRGRLWAMANDGPGCTFAFSIPYEQADSANDLCH